MLCNSGATANFSWVGPVPLSSRQEQQRRWWAADHLGVTNSDIIESVDVMLRPVLSIAVLAWMCIFHSRGTKIPKL